MTECQFMRSNSLFIKKPLDFSRGFIYNMIDNCKLNGDYMFKNKAINGKNNICGEKIHKLRKEQIPKMSQRIEKGERFVTDIELLKLAEIFGISCDELLKN